MTQGKARRRSPFFNLIVTRKTSLTLDGFARKQGQPPYPYHVIAIQRRSVTKPGLKLDSTRITGQLKASVSGEIEFTVGFVR